MLKEKIKEIELQLNYVCYDSKQIDKLKSVWKAFNDLKEEIENPDKSEDALYRVEEDKFLIYNSKTDQDVCTYFTEEGRNLLLNALNLLENE